MKVTSLFFAVLLLLSASSWAAADGSDEKLDAKIPKADPKKYKSVRDAKDWANPYLVVRADGVEVVSKAIAGGHKLVATKELPKTLATLPVGAWPYGRVVAAQEIGISSGEDEKPIKQNKAAVTGALKRLGVEVEWWPSA